MMAIIGFTVQAPGGSIGPDMILQLLSTYLESLEFFYVCLTK